MAGDNWYRNRNWNARISAEFEEKLGRARRQRAQYLVIQAGYLTNSAPFIALQLIDRYFEIGDDLFVASAHTIRAAAYVSLDRVEKALDAYKSALEWEKDHPHFIGEAWSGYCRLVAERGIEHEFDHALSVLSRDTIGKGGPFPAGVYQWNGCNALIAEAVGDRRLAKQFATEAIAAAEEKSSPFASHRKLGLVGQEKDPFRLKIEKILAD